MKPKNVKKLQARSKQLRARIIAPDTVIVTSMTNPVANHVVMVRFDPDGTIHARCTCPWAIHGGVACTHVMAALEALAAHKRRKLSFWHDEDEAKRQKHRLFRLVDGKDGIWITSRALS